MVVGALAVPAVILAVHSFVPHQWLHSALSGISGGGEGHLAHASEGSLGKINFTNPIPSGKAYSDCPENPPPFIDDTFPEPEMLHSQNGRLATSLKLAQEPTEIDGQNYITTAYNASFPGPTMVFCPGDTVRIYVRNFLNPANYGGEAPGQTSFHTHGLHVSPQKPQDNIYVKIGPNTSFQHRYAVPTDHRPGAYWYHPHRHGQTNVQVYGGAAGAMIVQGGLDNRAAYREIGQRVMVIQQTTLDSANATTVAPGPTGPFIPAGAQFFVNGKLNPTIPIKPGEIQRWHVLNLTAGAFVDVQLQQDGQVGQPFQVLGQDANYVPRIMDADHMLMAPASRREVLIEGPPEGTSQELVALPFAQFGGAPSAQQTLATLTSSGAAEPDDQPPPKVHSFRDLSELPVDNTHEIEYTQTPPNFFINGQKFDPRRLDEVMPLREVSEWTITNSTTFWHTFHIHIQDFQVTEVCTAPDTCEEANFIDDQDNVSVPPGGSVTMRTRPTQFTGRFVFHCHVLGHEDNGMMGTVRVVRPNSPLAG